MAQGRHWAGESRSSRSGRRIDGQDAAMRTKHPRRRPPRSDSERATVAAAKAASPPKLEPPGSAGSRRHLGGADGEEQQQGDRQEGQRGRDFDAAATVEKMASARPPGRSGAITYPMLGGETSSAAAVWRPPPGVPRPDRQNSGPVRVMRNRRGSITGPFASPNEDSHGQGPPPLAAADSGRRSSRRVSSGARSSGPSAPSARPSSRHVDRSRACRAGRGRGPGPEGLGLRRIRRSQQVGQDVG